MTINYLFDTNILIYLLNNRLAEKLPSGCYGYSVITEIELLSFPALTATAMETKAVLLTNRLVLTLKNN